MDEYLECSDNQSDTEYFDIEEDDEVEACPAEYLEKLLAPNLLGVTRYNDLSRSYPPVIKESALKRVRFEDIVSIVEIEDLKPDGEGIIPNNTVLHKVPKNTSRIKETVFNVQHWMGNENVVDDTAPHTICEDGVIPSGLTKDYKVEWQSIGAYDIN